MEHMDRCACPVTVEVAKDAGLLIRDLGVLCPAGDGCILELSLALEKVPPETRTALGLTVTELDGAGREYPRGTRTLLVGAHHGPGDADVAVDPVRFVLPAELDVSGGGTRRLLVRADANCVDSHGRCQLST